MAVLLSRLGASAHRHRLAVVAVSLLVLVGGGAGAVTSRGETATSFSTPCQACPTALERIAEALGGGGTSARVVLRAPDGQTLTAPENAAAVQRVVTELTGLPGAVSVTNPLDPRAPAVNQQQTTGYSTVG